MGSALTISMPVEGDGVAVIAGWTGAMKGWMNISER